MSLMPYPLAFPGSLFLSSLSFSCFEFSELPQWFTKWPTVALLYFFFFLTEFVFKLGMVEAFLLPCLPLFGFHRIAFCSEMDEAVLVWLCVLACVCVCDQVCIQLLTQQGFCVYVCVYSCVFVPACMCVSGHLWVMFLSVHPNVSCL